VLGGGWPTGNRQRKPGQCADISRIKRRLDHILGSVEEDCGGEWRESCQEASVDIRECE
jgi:hypothetical protein